VLYDPCLLLCACQRVSKFAEARKNDVILQDH
jgi:hypothetical protein